MKAVGVTQRVELVADYGERRDCLDQAWTQFLAACGLLPVLLPNLNRGGSCVVRASRYWRAAVHGR